MNETKITNDTNMLLEMINLQKSIDQRIFEKFGTSYQEIDIHSALLDEIGELNHELKPTWCWWKENPGEVDKNKVLEEFVDVVHFILMRAIRTEDSGLDNAEKWYFTKGFIDAHWEDENSDHTYKLYDLLRPQSLEFCGRNLFCISRKLGFDWQEVYEEYKRKNAINFERQENGY